MTLKDAVEQSFSIAGCLRLLDRAAVGSNYLWLKRQVATARLSTAHWKGQAHGTSVSPRRFKAILVLRKNSKHATGVIKRLVLREKLMPYACAECGQLPVWNGKPLVLRLDHRNGIRNDHRRENLRFLCPNCDSQSDTFCGRNKATVPDRFKDSSLKRRKVGSTPTGSANLCSRSAFT